MTNNQPKLSFYQGVPSALILTLLLNCTGCWRKPESMTNTRPLVMAEERNRFAVEHDAEWIDQIWTNTLVEFTVDYQDAMLMRNRPVAVEILFPDVFRDDVGLWITGTSIDGRYVNVEALITPEMLGEVRSAGGRVSAVWVALFPEQLTNTGIEDGLERLSIRGKVVGLQAREP